MAIIIDIQWR